jgi:phospholipid/cholesterol/gamma-HCH transport system ATP-binding protein
MRREGRWILRAISLDLQPGAILGVLGPPEAGKSALLKALAGLQSIEAGRIHREEGGAAPGPGQGGVGFAFQNNALFDDLDVFDNVALPLRQAGIDPSAIEARVLARLREVELYAARAQHPSALSGGMQKRLGVARATIGAPGLGLFDEPTAGLDPQTTGTILGLLQRLTQQLQMATLIVSHDLPALLPICSQILLLHAGRAVFCGSQQDLFASTHPVVRQFIRGSLKGPL